MADHRSQATLHLVLVPKTDESGDVVALHFSITTRDLALKGGDFLCAYGRRDEAHLSRLQHYLQGIPATVRDADGPVPFDLSGDDAKEVRVTRGVIGDIVFASEVQALKEGEGSSDASALLRDQRGVIGAGSYFLPRFNLDECRMLVEWDLSGCPAGIRAVSSFAEGPGPAEILGSSMVLLDCVFMVGPGLESFPPAGSPSPGPTGAGATYWFGELPENLEALKDYATKIFPRMAEHFEDEGGSYRAFLRRVPKGLRGTALGPSGLIDYDEDARNEQDWDLVRLLNRTMVSAWARLDPEDDGAENDWFTLGELAQLPFLSSPSHDMMVVLTDDRGLGLAYLYSVFLPFRFGQRGPDYFRATVNAFLSAYFTSPLVSKPLSELLSLAPSQDWYAVSARATRAFVYMLKMDAFTRRAAVARGVDVLRPMDELIRELLPRRGQPGAKIQRKDWLDGVAHWLGQEDAERYFQEMLEDGGRVNELEDMASSFGKTYGPQPVDQEALEFGFGRESLEEGVVRGVVEGSRAWEAGLKDGDKILWHSRLEACEIHHERKFKLAVEREGYEVDIEYWPRSTEKVRCWQVLERPKTEGENGAD